MRTTAAYLVAAFAAAQVMQLLVDALGLPPSLLRGFVVLELALIPVVVGVAWVFDMTRDGLEATAVDGGPDSGRPWRRLAVPVAATVVLLVAGAFLSARVQVAPAPDTIRTLAVLPFVNTGGVVEDDYFGDGMTDELAHALSRIPRLRLAGRTSTFVFKGRAVAAQEIGRSLDVEAIVAGTVRRSGERLRVTAQLVGTGDGKVVWDSVFESRSDDVFGVQDEFTRAIVTALGPALGVTATSSRSVPRGTRDQEAYDLYLRGRYHWLERGRENVERSIDYFRQAIARDSAFARAHAGLALAYGVLPVYAPQTTDSSTALMIATAERAVALDPELADAQIALASALDRRLRFAEAEQHYQSALALDPGSATAWHWAGMSLLTLGRTEEALRALRRAIEMDPLAKSAGTGVGLALLFSRRWDEAEAAARRVLALDSTFPLAIEVVGRARAHAGRSDEAIATLLGGTELYPDAPRLRSALLFAYALAGRWDEAEGIRVWLARPGGDPSGGIESAFAEMVFGDRGPLLDLLATEAGRRRFVAYGGFFGCDPNLDPLWSEEEFVAVMAASGIEPCALVGRWPSPPV